ncbi:MAG: hypothetical protein GKS05_02345 [Nitrospirales bacterium]|nr:hypothetical protein [Nitrospirales bacterium]
MAIAGVSVCPSCGAVINIHWASCPACATALEPQAVPPPTPEQWVTSWRELAHLTNGIEKTEQQFHPVLQALDECDRAFLPNDWPRFQAAVEKVRRVVSERG